MKQRGRGHAQHGRRSPELGDIALRGLIDTLIDREVVVSICSTSECNGWIFNASYASVPLLGLVHRLSPLSPRSETRRFDDSCGLDVRWPVAEVLSWILGLSLAAVHWHSSQMILNTFYRFALFPNQFSCMLIYLSSMSIFFLWILIDLDWDSTDSYRFVLFQYVFHFLVPDSHRLDWPCSLGVWQPVVHCGHLWDRSPGTGSWVVGAL